MTDDVIAIAERVRSGETTAVAIAEAALGRIDARDGELHAFLGFAPFGLEAGEGDVAVWLSLPDLVRDLVGQGAQVYRLDV